MLDTVSAPAPPASYPAESVGRHRVERVPTARADETIAGVLARIAAVASWDSLTYVYVLDAERRPIGLVTIEELFAGPPSATLGERMRRDLEVVRPLDDQERAAVIAIDRELDAVPVVDENGAFEGAVDYDGLLEILHHEHVEDLLRRGGVRTHRPIADALDGRVRDLVGLRLPWLLLGLAGGMVATALVELFEPALRRELALAFFIPVIVYMSDAVGTQTETIYVRSLALGRRDVGRYLAREARVGLTIGAICALLMAAFALLWFGSTRVAAIVGMAMFASIAIATLIGVAVPWTLERLGRDPAFGSGPLATVVQDLLSLLVYFGVASLVLLA
jgi:magnesium transporter